MVSETLLIADLHLDPSRPKTISFFLDFVANRVNKAEALYILGDLFEVWLGDDEDEPVYQQILVALQQLTDKNFPVFVMQGNRDFLLGQTFAETTDCQLIDEPYLIDLYGTSTLLMHGDILCTLDTEYQTFRQQVRHPQWQAQFLAQPLPQRRILAQKARSYSITKGQTSAEAIMDVNPEAVMSILEKYQVYNLIHGHTHRPAIHQLTLNGQTAYRRVVGDWRDDSAVILSCTPENCQLIDLYA